MIIVLGLVVIIFVAIAGIYIGAKNHEKVLEEVTALHGELATLKATLATKTTFRPAPLPTPAAPGVAVGVTSATSTITTTAP